MNTYVLALDLIPDEALIAAYEQHHQAVWPEIKQSIIDAGVLDMQIYRTGNRLVMFMLTADDFSFERKAALDQHNPKAQEWEELMWKYQQALPGAKAGEKWVLMKKIFSL